MAKVKLPTKAHFRAYLRVQFRGTYNMFDPRAWRATGLTREEFGAVQDNYDLLAEKYPDVLKEEDR